MPYSVRPPTTVRKALEAAIRNQPNLLDAIREFPVEERGEINRLKLGLAVEKECQPDRRRL
jgi:hypothetical protein